jgi:hypothetical protein
MKFIAVAFGLLLLQASSITPPKTWDEQALRDWATPVAGLNVRPGYLHDGSVTTLEEMFSPARLQDDFVPTGFIPFGQKTRAVKGHEFGLKLPEEDKAALLAFLRSL